MLIEIVSLSSIHDSKVQYTCILSIDIIHVSMGREMLCYFALK